MTTKKDRITTKARELLAKTPEGLRFADLARKVRRAFPDIPKSSVEVNICGLEIRFHEEIYKPERGLYRHRKYAKIG